MITKKRKISYEFLEGKGTSKFNLVFVHGTCCSKKFLRPLAEKLDDFNCYLMDLPGHGDSDNTGYSIENYLKSIGDFVSDIENVVLIGHSLGGGLVVGAGELNFPSVKAIVPLNGGADFRGLNKDLVNEVNNDIFNVERISKLMGHIDQPIVQKSLAGLESPEIGLIDFKIDINVDFNKDLDKINVPALIIGGETDVLVSPEKSECLHKKIKNSQLLIIPDTMHTLPLVRRDEVSKIIKKFVTQL